MLYGAVLVNYLQTVICFCIHCSLAPKVSLVLTFIMIIIVGNTFSVEQRASPSDMSSSPERQDQKVSKVRAIIKRP